MWVKGGRGPRCVGEWVKEGWAKVGGCVVEKWMEPTYVIYGSARARNASTTNSLSENLF